MRTTHQTYRLVCFITASLITIDAVAQSHKMKVIYAYDALCGWCYGFEPVMQAYAAKHPEVEIEVLSGGMITGSRIGPIGEVAPYIKWAYKDVENAAGVTFGKAFLEDVLEDGKAVFTSIPAGLALTAFKQLVPDKALAYAAALQKAVYYYGIIPSDMEAFADLAAKLGAKREEFLKLAQSPDIKQMTQDEFLRVSRLGVRGFPAVLVEKNGQFQAAVSGYVPLAELERRLK